MKKIIMLMLVALLMLGVSGQAMAAFNEGDLIRVVYTGTGAGTEYATDLGNFSNLTTPIAAQQNLTSDLFSMSSVGASSWSNATVAYFIYSGTGAAGNGGAWTSNSATGGYAQLGAFGSNFQGPAFTTLAGYQFVASGNNATLQQANGSSYWLNMNTGGTAIGQMGGYLDPLKANNSADQNLASLATTGYVDQYLYYYGSDPEAGGRGTAVALIRTFADGSTSLMQVTQTPIPAAAYLFGSGLLGMFGLRRKIVA